MSLLKTDKDAVLSGDLEFTGLVSVDRLAPLHYPEVEISTVLGAIPVYNKAGELVGWVPVYDAHPPYQIA